MITLDISTYFALVAIVAVGWAITYQAGFIRSPYYQVEGGLDLPSIQK